METESDQKKYVNVSVDYIRTPNLLVELDESLDPDDLDGDYSFEHWVKHELLCDQINDKTMCVISEEESEDEPDHFIYKNESGHFQMGNTVPKNTKSVMKFHFPNGTKKWEYVHFRTDFTFIKQSLESFISSDSEKVKEEVKEEVFFDNLKHGFVPSRDSQNPEVLKRIWKFRNNEVKITLEDKDYYCKGDGMFEVLVDNTNPESESVS